jgi:hypothetical protein
MTTAKNTAKKSSVRNSKATYNTGKNNLAESMMQRSFTPLLNKFGQARLTFCGVEHSSSKNDKPFMKLVFSVLDITHDAPANIGILSSYRYSEENKLGRFLDILGYTAPAIEYTSIDDDDEFGIKATNAGVDGIFEFLRERCGLVFKATLEKMDSGLYRIDINSLEAMMKDGTQQSDYMASDVTDETFENPNIDIDDVG